MAAERDRLKDIKNEMARRRDFEGSEKNFKPQPQPQQEEVPNEIKASLTLNTKRTPKPTQEPIESGYVLLFILFSVQTLLINM